MILLSREWLGMVLVLGSSAPLIAQSLSAPTYQESITLDLDNAVAKRLATVPDFAEQNQWGSVATLLKQTIEENNEKLVSMAPGWYVGVSRFCQCQAAVLPPAGLAVYRRQVDHLVQEWLADADRLATTDPDSSRAQLRKVLQQAFGSSHSPAALRRLAEQSFEQADYSAARTYWEMLLPASSSLRAAAGLGLLRQPDVPAGCRSNTSSTCALQSVFRKPPTGGAGTRRTASHGESGRSAGSQAARVCSLSY